MIIITVLIFLGLSAPLSAAARPGTRSTPARSPPMPSPAEHKFLYSSFAFHPDGRRSTPPAEASAVATAPGDWLLSLFGGGRHRRRHPSGEAGNRRESRERALLDGRLPIASRTVPLGPIVGGENSGARDRDMSVTVWEVERPTDCMQTMWSAAADPDVRRGRRRRRRGGEPPPPSDPYGMVVWPGGILASRELIRRHADGDGAVSGRRVLVLGCGPGAEVLTAAALGAAEVVALDASRLALELTEYGARRAGFGDVVEARRFDLLSDEPLPECDVAVAADLVYTEELARGVGGRCVELMAGRYFPPAEMIVTVSYLRGDHSAALLDEVNSERSRGSAGGGRGTLPPLRWEEHQLGDIRGSGILGGVSDDQTYKNVRARLLTA